MNIQKLQIESKVANKGTSSAGKLTAEEFNQTVNKINEVIEPLNGILEKSPRIPTVDASNMLSISANGKEYVSIGPHATIQTRQATDGTGNGVINVASGSIAFSADVSIENVKLKINKSTGIFTVQCVDTSTSLGQVAPLTTGCCNTIGSNNVIQSNITIYDRSTVGATIISYEATGLLSIRQNINGGAYSGIEHLNVGGYNVIGSNNTLASNINIGDRVQIASGVNITLANISSWNNKVSQVAGKGLSTNDFTNSYKAILDEIGGSIEVGGVNIFGESNEFGSRIQLGDDVTIGQNSYIDNVKLLIDKQTGILSLTNVAGVGAMTMGIYNNFGSSNLLQSNISIYDRSTLNAHVVSYATTGILSLRHVIDTSAYSGMEHLQIGGYNVFGSNNKLASNINIGDKVTIEAKSILPANIGILVVNNRIRVIGAEKLIAAGYVPYVFRKVRSSGIFHMTYNGANVAPERHFTRLKTKKGWRVYGSYHAYKIVNGELHFSLQEKRYWHNNKAEKKGFSGEPGALVTPRLNDDKTAVLVAYGTRTILSKYDQYGHARRLRLEYALAFGLPRENGYYCVTPDEMLTPLIPFSVVFSPTEWHLPISHSTTSPQEQWEGGNTWAGWWFTKP